MSMFSHIEGGQVLITQKGIYQEAKLYKRGEELFISLKNGFARLLTNNLTTAPNVRWKEIEGISYSVTPEGPREVIPTPAAQPARKKLRAV
ncbi:hypothetical protein [Mesorhizobium sp. M7A.F.Ca.CA.002.12.1.1]|uniref:hypothetical protein n=1 Tax=Mesorhizobium sp. M7A.F.Ca.CA.002.12.1.1 TaxID=2496735 RepID=UPI000FCA0BDC|nr:hypothetical protein [Mesorhizobium sp. M7A.F.Ca.CA.002.12.1.1]RUX60198.1 hypothetical protein EN989_11330 [Mesorhizobium sp. M7A.F.Ca.CA.002.12.1.1]